jgi:hydroxymethylglutaryl-CoA lyase
MKRLLRDLPKFVRVVEVGPRDGLQNENHYLISSAVRLELIRKLEKSGISSIEVGSFVSPKWVPQMAGTDEIFRNLSRYPSHLGTSYSALTPNIKGLESAIDAGAKEVAVFAAATESFSQRNINCSIADSVKRFEEVAKVAEQHGIKIRGYVSCVLGCPYEGMAVSPEKVLDVSQRLLDIGCYEISLGDTIGVGKPLYTIALSHVCNGMC